MRSRIKPQAQKRKESSLSIFFFGLVVFQSGALRDHAQRNPGLIIILTGARFQFSFLGLWFFKAELCGITRSVIPDLKRKCNSLSAEKPQRFLKPLGFVFQKSFLESIQFQNQHSTRLFTFFSLV